MKRKLRKQTKNTIIQARKERKSLEIKPKETATCTTWQRAQNNGVKMLNELMKMTHEENKNSNEDPESDRSSAAEECNNQTENLIKEVHQSLIKQNKE